MGQSWTYCLTIGGQTTVISHFTSATTPTFATFASPITDALLHDFRENPEIAIFLSIAIGTVIGQIKFGKFHLASPIWQVPFGKSHFGTVAGSLLMGLIIGQIDIEIPNVLKAVFFALFIYSMAFKNGPEFFGSLNRGNIKLVLLSVILCVTGLASILLMNTIFGFDASFAVGLGAGALTDTAMM